jgi:hypothetical protein
MIEAAAKVSSATPAAESSMMRDAFARLRRNLVRFPGPAHAAEALAATIDRWRDRDSPDRRAAIAKIIAHCGAGSRWSPELLEQSLDALLTPFSHAALASFARGLTPRPRMGGFIMPANVPGAGLHELLAALISGAAAIVKTSHREPVFFHDFAHTLREIDPVTGGLLEVINFGREREDLLRQMNQECDFVVALGDDASLTHFSGAPRLFGFGSRTSGALISGAMPANLSALAAAIARDAALFEQQGCLSPQHIFLAEADGLSARDFAKGVAEALASLAETLPSAALSFQTAAAIRRVRERARWRGFGGQEVELFEGSDLSWTVIFEPAARFTISPGYRTVTVSTVRDADDFAARLAPVTGRIEAFALAAPPHSRAKFLDVLAGAGVTYVSDPGALQSPPFNWPHGGGAFLDFIATRDE